MKTHNRITFELSAGHAHDLLRELENALCIVNRDKTAALLLWFILSYQLAGSSYDDAIGFAKRDIQQKKEMDEASKKVEQEIEENKGIFERIRGLFK